MNDAVLMAQIQQLKVEIKQREAENAELRKVNASLSASIAKMAEWRANTPMMVPTTQGVPVDPIHRPGDVTHRHLEST